MRRDVLPLGDVDTEIQALKTRPSVYVLQESSSGKIDVTGPTTPVMFEEAKPYQNSAQTRQSIYCTTYCVRFDNKNLICFVEFETGIQNVEL